VALRVGGHADLVERPSELVDGAEERQPVVEVAMILGVAADDEHAAEASLGQTREQVLEVLRRPDHVR
jgi:hypothetical protein